MKVKSDPRHIKRIHLMQQLFSWNANPNIGLGDIDKIVDNVGTIDEYIEKSAPLWPIAQINKIDLAILRLAVFELSIAPTVLGQYTKKGEAETPPKVVIDEAVELAKEYGSDNSPSFVNGVLGKLVELQGIKT